MGIDLYNLVIAAKLQNGGGGGGDGYTGNDIAMRTISGAISGSATSIGSYAFYSCSALTAASFPSATSIGDSAFGYCTALTAANIPSATRIGNSAFFACYALTAANFPNVTSIGGSAFEYCSALTAASFPKATSIGSSAFAFCHSLTEAYFLASSVASLMKSGVFSNTPMVNSTYTGSFGSIYVPASLVDSYKAASNWSVYKDRITSYVE